ncbi:MAG: hypothetical protein ACLP59_21985 [Bryobacteraceae bacterium]
MKKKAAASSHNVIDTGPVWAAAVVWTKQGFGDWHGFSVPLVLLAE